MTLSTTNINKLRRWSEEPGTKVSIYIPTHPKSNGPNVQEDKTRLKNALQQLKARKPKHDEGYEALLKKIKELFDAQDFWLTQSRSLAILADEKSLEYIRLPIEVEPRVHVSDHFDLSPLLLANSMHVNSFVLDLNLTSPRLFIADAASMTEIADIPLMSLKEMMEGDHQQHQQFYSPQGRAGSPMFHGHGGADDHAQEEIDIYLRYLASRLQPYVAAQGLPLLLAGEKHRVMQFKKMFDSQLLHKAVLEGSYQHTDEAEIHKKVRDLLQQTAEKEISQAMQSYESPSLMAMGVKDVMAALKRKAVDVLYAPYVRKTKDSVQDGYKDSYLVDFDEMPDSFEEVVKRTLEQGGKVQAVPHDSKSRPVLRASLRY